MADEFFNQMPAALAGRSRSGVRTRVVLGTALLAFVLGGGAVGYATWQGLIPLQRLAAPAVSSAVVKAPSAPAAARPASDPAALAAAQTALEARVIALSERLDSLNLAATAASGNAARAEALLVAAAARRALDRGAPLGLLEDQLRLRFGNAQPNAVGTVINAARTPVTLDQLVAGLDALTPALTASPASAGSWTRLKQELAGLFVIRRQSAPSPTPQAILRRARVLLKEGRTDDAAAEVRRLPGARDASDWFRAARRYADARRALDVLETTALIEPRAPASAAPKPPVDAAAAAAASPAPVPAPTT